MMYYLPNTSTFFHDKERLIEGQMIFLWNDQVCLEDFEFIWYVIMYDEKYSLYR